MKKLKDYLYYEEKNPDLKIYHGNCLEIMPLLPKVDLVVTDPPYGIKYDEQASLVGGSKSKNGSAYKTKHESFGWDEEAPHEIINSIIGTGVKSIIWGGNYFNVSPQRCWFFWDKMNDGKTFADGELAWTNLGGSLRRLQYLWDGMLQANMKEKEQRWHPTQKPVPVIRWCIEQAEKKKLEINSVLDPFLGSGTTLVACKELNRSGIGIEINEKYCEIAKRRLLATTRSLF